MHPDDLLCLTKSWAHGCLAASMVHVLLRHADMFVTACQAASVVFSICDDSPPE